MSGHSLLLAFDRDTTDFRDGFECGRLWTMAQYDEDEIIETVHCTNGEMLLRIGEALNRRVSWEELRDGWAEVTIASTEDKSGIE